MANGFFRSVLRPGGRINTKLDGRFQTVVLDELTQDKLQQLYDNGCPYVELTNEGGVNYLPTRKISMRKIKGTK